MQYLILSGTTYYFKSFSFFAAANSYYQCLPLEATTSIGKITK
jgi:hypothetical protein